MRKYKYKWSMAECASESPELLHDISDALGVTCTTAQLLINRGCRSVGNAEAFIAKTDAMLHDPFLLDGMEKAAEKILDTALKGEKIVVYGDYDVDGVTSVCAMLTYLKTINDNVGYYIPNRAGEGYGISEEAVRKFASEGVSLIITVDTGITAVEEARLCADLGICFVVTDHHECHDTLPEAFAIVNPRKPGCPYPFKELAGVGVVFKVLCAIEKLRSGDDLYTSVKRICRDYIDLTAVGTVADVMPLIDENRLIVAEGLRKIENTDRTGLEALMDAVALESKRQGTHKKITSGYISYTIAPRINAAGRISSAAIAVELLLSDDRERASALARKLCEINRERQQEENEIAESARAKIDSDESVKNMPVIVLDDESWHHGIIGIVSSRITERYSKPSVMISFDGSYSGEPSPEDMGKGSGRSIKGMNLVDALSSCSDILEKYGGHELAAGLTIKRKNLPEFRRRLAEFAEKSFDGADVRPGFEYDMEISAADVTMRQASELYLLEPYGVSNPQPLFVVRGLEIKDLGTVGGGKHTKFTVKCGDADVTVMCFRRIPEDYDIYPGDFADILFSLDINEFQGQKNLQFIAKDLRLTEIQYKRELEEREEYEKLAACLREGAPLPEEVPESAVPTRDDFAFVYRLLKSELQMEHEVFSIRALLHLIKRSGGSVSYAKLRFIIRILDELCLIGAEETDTELEKFCFRYIRVSQRTSLENSELYRTLKHCLEK